VLIANVVAKTADAVFALPGDQFTSGTAWVGIFAYTLQIYFDFSGYSDMAIGLSKMFGFEIKENFDHPYVSRSIQEFWRRWHISLSTWFKEYLYIPLGGNRKGSARTYINLLIVFFATGLWHGASWNFVLWGMYHGAFLVLERAAGMGKVTGFKILRTFYTLLVVLSGWVIFRAETLGQAARYLKNMFSFNFGADALLYLNKELIIVFAVGILASGFIQQAHGAAVKNKIYKYCFTWARPMALSVFLFFCVLYMANNTYNPFIYFRF
jgi:alginate O-acetyltransferase complex protein AlgI